jgi:E3 ubiquitin-protein ligase NRDP1
MGYDVGRFVGEVDEELLCPICGHVLENPLQIKNCEHCFCTACIKEWLKHQSICPVDRSSVPNRGSNLVPAPRILRNLLSRLKIKCENERFGCTVVVHLDGLTSHMDQCQYNPKRPVSCDKGCGSTVPLDELSNHNCVRELRQKVESQAAIIDVLSSQVKGLKQELIEQRGEIALLKDIIHNMRTTPPTILSAPNYPDEVDHSIQTVQWLSTLKPARIRHWGGIISTPDGVLQSIIRRSLMDSGCPQYLLVELMANAHERRWPAGLRELETRQSNRDRYEQYVTKRVPGKQAVIVMATENEHMGETMIVPPGMVIIFAHGVED